MPSESRIAQTLCSTFSGCFNRVRANNDCPAIDAANSIACGADNVQNNEPGHRIGE